jgi:hypothetical protein
LQIGQVIVDSRIMWRLWLSPEVFEPIRRQLRVAGGVLDIPMPEIGLQGPDILPLFVSAKP